jgi:hypothetical protein
MHVTYSNSRGKPNQASHCIRRDQVQLEVIKHHVWRKAKGNSTIQPSNSGVIFLAETPRIKFQTLKTAVDLVTTQVLFWSDYFSNEKSLHNRNELWNVFVSYAYMHKTTAKNITSRLTDNIVYLMRLYERGYKLYLWTQQTWENAFTLN